MKAELVLWRFGLALMGGKWIAAVSLALVAMSYAALAYVLLHPLRLFNGAQSFLEPTALLAATLFFALAFVPTALRSSWHKRPLLRLAPGAKGMLSALTRRLIVIALIAMVPAVMLRALLWSKLNADIYATISFADVTWNHYVLVALYLAHVVALIAITFGPFKVLTQFVFFPIAQGTMQSSSGGYLWLPVVSCLVLVIIRWSWPQLEAWIGTEPQRSRPSADRKSRLLSWWTARLQKRAAGAPAGTEGASLRISALLTRTAQTPLNIMTGGFVVIYLALKPGLMDDLVLSWLLAFPIAVVLAQLSPLPLGRIMLLPLGVERQRMGQILTAVWVRELTARMLVCALLGFALHTLFWWLQWPAFIRSSLFTRADVSTQLLRSPLAQSVGLYGMALGACLLWSASPRLLEKPSFLRTGPIAAVGALAVVGVALTWALNVGIPATDARDMGHITFAAVNGVMLPAGARCVNRALRYQWATANLAAISAAMQA